MKHGFGNLEQCKMIIEKEFETIKQSRSYTKNLEIIKNTRKKLIGAMNINDYVNLLNNHIAILTTILVNKGHQDKRIVTTITKSLSSLDMRLVKYGCYYDIQLDTNEYLGLVSGLYIFSKSYSYYSPFIFNDFIKQFFNYGSVVRPVKTCIETFLINKYGFYNVVYVPLKQSTDDDPYSFYTLESVSKDKRYWKMDCRLAELSDGIINSISTYLISLFRSIYVSIFNDNDYRDDYNKKTVLTDNDFKQLLENIFILKNNKFYNFIRNMIKDKAVYTPTENDKFNLYGDELILKKRFSKNRNTSDNIDVVKSLFDNITSEQAVDLYRSFS